MSRGSTRFFGRREAAAVAAVLTMAAEAEAEAAVAAREAADLAGVTVAVLADEAVVAALALAAAKAGRGSLRFRGSLGGRSGMSVPCGSGCGEGEKMHRFQK